MKIAVQPMVILSGRGGQNRIVVPKKWTNNTGGYYNNITVQFVMEVSLWELSILQRKR